MFAFAYAANIAPSYAEACDAEIREVHKASAWRSAKRDIEMAETLILHPDSVLEYSCLNSYFSDNNNTWDLSRTPPSDLDLSEYDGRSSEDIAAERDQVLEQIIDLRNRMTKYAFDYTALDFQQPGYDEDNPPNPDTEWERVITRLPATDGYFRNSFNPKAVYREMYEELIVLDGYTNAQGEFVEGVYQELQYAYADASAREQEVLYDNRNPPINPDPELDYANFTGQKYAVNVMNQYLTQNYFGNYAGGTSSDSGICASMQEVWETLACRNFDEASFKSFTQMESSDPRSAFAICQEPERNQKWTYNNTAATPFPGQSGGMDTVITYLKNLMWIEDTECGNSAVILTGLTVNSNGTIYKDGYCTLPGCYYRDEQCQ
ncbi:MAG: hypothetical protein KTR28_03545 [Micavibrio sp.]|nr:hypothetical protein [Micavibrio sp.]